MALQKTSLALDVETCNALMERYSLGISEIVRLALNYVLEKAPTLTTKTQKFEGGS